MDSTHKVPVMYVLSAVSLDKLLSIDVELSWRPCDVTIMIDDHMHAGKFYDWRLNVVFSPETGWIEKDEIFHLAIIR